MSTLTTIQSTDLITNSRADINGNFAALNADKMETSVLDTDTTLAANSDAKIPSQKAVKAYVDAGGNVNASTTSKGIVEEATAAEVLAGSATGATGARLFINPSTLPTINVQTFTASGTWTKPSAGTKVLVQAWGGGGSGGMGTSLDCGGGGGGGAYMEKWFAIGDCGATETVTIGAGGAKKTSAGAGNVGGNTTFGSLVTVYGGGGGAGNTGGAGGGGGGIKAVGSVGSASTGGAGGSPVAGAGGSSAIGGGSNFGGAGGGAGNGAGIGYAGGEAVFGGGGGGGTGQGSGGGAGGASYYGGGGGGAGAGDSTPGGGAGGVSLYGGNGGAGAYDANNATAGTQPAGGGGGSELGESGAGADGKCIVTVF